MVLCQASRERAKSNYMALPLLVGHGEKTRHECMESPGLENGGAALWGKWQTFKRPNLVSL